MRVRGHSPDRRTPGPTQNAPASLPVAESVAGPGVCRELPLAAPQPGFFIPVGGVIQDVFIAHKEKKRKKIKEAQETRISKMKKGKMTCQFTPKERPLYKLVYFFPVFFLCEHGKNRSRALEGNRFLLPSASLLPTLTAAMCLVWCPSCPHFPSTQPFLSPRPGTHARLGSDLLDWVVGARHLLGRPSQAGPGAAGERRAGAEPRERRELRGAEQSCRFPSGGGLFPTRAGPAAFLCQGVLPAP